MTELRLVLERGSLEVTPSCAVLGRLFFRSSSGAFPDDAWSDFALVVLGWWTEALATLQQRGATEVELRFMDGPFALRLRRSEDDVLAVDMVDASRNRTLGSANVRLEEIVRDVARAAEVVLDFADQRLLSNREVDVLRRGVSRLDLA